MLVSAESRPRTLDWKHAGPLLFGDWGTSRLYVLGLAFYYTAHASVTYLAVMSVLLVAVAWAYAIVCRCFPEGGGVYTAARQLNPVLSVVGATLLLCDFIVTAALSAVEGFHYLGVAREWVVPCAVGTIAILGIVNWFGARAAGRFALLIAVAAILMSAVIGILCVPMLPDGLATIRLNAPGVDGWWHRWESLVRIVLALSGVEAVANMTGLMKLPVERTSKRTIWPVLAEVVVLNLVFGIALNALPALQHQVYPDYVTYELTQGVAPDAVPEATRQYRDTAVRMLAEHAGQRAGGDGVGRWLGAASGIVFGMLLISAVNTAIMAMVSVLYALAQDRELPRPLSRLNYSGVPWIALVVACAAPALLLPFSSDPKVLSELYAIGVVGAIAVNVLCCAANRGLKIRRWERAGLWTLGAVMTAVELTIVVAKPHATAFAGSVIVVVLLARFFVRAKRRAEPLPVPAGGWMEELRDTPIRPGTSPARIMLAARGRDNAEFAVDLARRRGGVLFAISIRTLRVLDVQPDRLPRLADDPVAQETLGTVAVLAKQAGVPFVPIYVTSPNIAEEILDYTVTYGCDTLILGKSKRSVFARKVGGDVLARVAEHLPDGVSLVTRAMGVQAPVGSLP